MSDERTKNSFLILFCFKIDDVNTFAFPPNLVINNSFEASNLGSLDLALA